jgi:hypothetical protein
MQTQQQPDDKGPDRLIVTVTAAAVGWEVRTERDGRTITRRTYRDWHRVERALQQLGPAPRCPA